MRPNSMPDYTTAGRGWSRGWAERGFLMGIIGGLYRGDTKTGAILSWGLIYKMTERALPPTPSLMPADSRPPSRACACVCACVCAVR